MDFVTNHCNVVIAPLLNQEHWTFSSKPGTSDLFNACSNKAQNLSKHGSCFHLKRKNDGPAGKYFLLQILDHSTAKPLDSSRRAASLTLSFLICLCVLACTRKRSKKIRTCASNWKAAERLNLFSKGVHTCYILLPFLHLATLEYSTYQTCCAWTRSCHPNNKMDWLCYWPLQRCHYFPFESSTLNIFI